MITAQIFVEQHSGRINVAFFPIFSAHNIALKVEQSVLNLNKTIHQSTTTNLAMV
jgi:hypothetical protein